MVKVVHLPRATFFQRSFSPGHRADVKYFPKATPIYHGAKYIDSDGNAGFSRLVGYALPGGFLSFTNGLPPKTVSAAIAFWKDHEKNELAWVPRFRRLSPARQMEYLRVFFGYDDSRNFFEKATISTARRISALARHDLALARKIFWRTGEISPLDFDSAVFYALSNPLLQARLLVGRGAVQGACLLIETFEDRTYDDLEAARILIQGEGLSTEEKQTLREINKLFFQEKGGMARSFIIRRLLVWQTRLTEALDFSRFIERKLERNYPVDTLAVMKRELSEMWSRLSEGLGRYSTPELYELLLLFYQKDRLLILGKMMENGCGEQVQALNRYLINDMGNKF